MLNPSALHYVHEVYFCQSLMLGIISENGHIDLLTGIERIVPQPQNLPNSHIPPLVV